MGGYQAASEVTGEKIKASGGRGLRSEATQPSLGASPSWAVQAASGQCHRATALGARTVLGLRTEAVARMRQGLQLLLLLPVVVGVLLGGAAVLRMLEGETETLHNWVDSTYFCFTTLTTIGYGNFAPTTSSGRWFVTLYCILGIPVYFAFIALLSVTATRCSNGVITAMAERRDWHAAGPRSRKRFVSWLNAMALVILLFAYIILSTSFIYFYGDLANWSECFYFIIITFTTVGYGDISPYDVTQPETGVIAEYDLAIFITITVIGMTLLGMVLTAIQDYIQHLLDRTYQQVEHVLPAPFLDSVKGLDVEALAPPALEDTWVCLAGHLDGALRVWDMNSGVFWAELDAGYQAPGEPSPMMLRQFSSTDSQTGSPGKRGGMGALRQHAGPPVSCCLLPSETSREPTAVSVHRRGQLLAWSIGGSAAPLASINAVQELTSGRQDGRGRLLCGLKVSLGEAGDCVVTGDSFGKVGVWSLEAGQGRFVSRVSFNVEEDVRCLGPMSTGRQLLAAGGSPSLLWRDRGVLSLWDLEQQHQVFRLDNLKCGVFHTVAMLDDNLIATGCASGASISLWDVRQSGHTRCGVVFTSPALRGPVQTLEGHTGGVNALLALPSQQQLVSGSADATIAMWDVRAGKTLHVLAGHSGPVTSLSLVDDPDGDPLQTAQGRDIQRGGNGDNLLVLSGSEDGTLKLWEKRRASGLFVNRHTYYVPNEGDSGGVCCSAVAFVPPNRPRLSRLSAPGVLSRPSAAAARPDTAMAKATSAPQALSVVTATGACPADRLGRFSAVARLQYGPYNGNVAQSAGGAAYW
eukprot:jgi/Tetstr1/435971/TSEL_024852.t1